MNEKMNDIESHKGRQFEYKLVIVTRQDLKLSPGKLAVQVAHAAVSCALSAKRKETEWFESWYEEGQKKVVVKAPALQDLFVLKQTAERAGLSVALIQDAGMTEIPAGTITCLGIGPGPANAVDKITGHLKLV